jgi:MtN3 and saliva related transmembrane protein
MQIEEIIGFIAAASTTISFIPQAIKTIKTRQTKDISLLMYALLTFGVLMWTIYGFMTKDTPVLMANGITIIFASIVLILKLKHK